MLLRRLTIPATAALPTRSIATIAQSMLPQWLNHRPAPNDPTKRPTRPFSHTAPCLSSSPFRLTSKSTPPTPEIHDTSEHDDYEYYEDEAENPYAPYKPKRQWPPDMTKLSPKHQFRLERKYRRRAALKFARPKWTKGTKLIQWGVIGFTLVYALLFMQWDERGSPFDELRNAFFTGTKAAFSAPPPPGSAKRSERENS